MTQIYREITPLTPHDCFTLFSRQKRDFDFPLHVHEEFELNLIIGAKGVKRIVGDHTEVINDYELVLVGSNLPHAWVNHDYRWDDSKPEILEVTIQFHKDLFDEKLLGRNQMYFIRNLLNKASKGILFSQETAIRISTRISQLPQKYGFDSLLELLSILHDLAVSRNMRELSNAGFVSDSTTIKSRRLQKAFDYMNQHFEKEITLSEVAKLVGMAEVSFSRFVKKSTGKTFIESLNEIRLGHTSRLLIDSTQSIAEIAYKCGFNNMSYFNRIFKQKNGCTPKEFRENYTGKRTFI